MQHSAEADNKEGVKQARKKRDPKATKAAILSAADKMFVRKGYDGASLSEIARTARVTQSLIHHYFGSKEKLFLEVIRLYLVRFGRLLQAGVGSEVEDPVQVLGAARSYFELLGKADDLVQMGARMTIFFQENPVDVRHQSVGIPEEDKAQGYIFELCESIIQGTYKLQEKGQIRADIHPAYILLAVFSLVEHWYEAKNRMLRRLQPEHSQGLTDQGFMEAFLLMIGEGILPRR